MPVVSVHNPNALNSPTVSTNGTQYVEGILNISSAMTVYLNSAVYTSGGYYVLFDYSAGSFTGNVSNITINTTGTPDLTFNSIINDTANSRILISLDQDKTDSIQYVDGVLNISAAMTIYLNADLFGSEGVYTLFDFSGGSFTGSASNITVVPLKSGLSGGVPYVDGSTIKVRLLRS